MTRRSPLRAALALLSPLLLLLGLPAATAAPDTLRDYCQGYAYTLPYASLIAETFDYEPKMVMISCCESKGSTTARNPRSSAVGLFQVMRSVWGKYARDNGHDITTGEGNIAVAIHILEVQGLRAWRASRQCWG